MSKFYDDIARGCLPTGEPLENLYGVGWWTEEDEPEPEPEPAELEAERRWVPVSERLPEENQQILSTDGKEFYLDYYARWEGKDKPPCFCDGLSWAVTHWMPLPSAPESEDE